MSETRRMALTVSHKYADVICAACSVGNSIVADGGEWHCGHCGALLPAPVPDDSACSTCREPQNAAGYCTNKQYSRHGRRNDYLASDASPGQTHYEGCERTAADALDRAREDSARLDWLRDNTEGGIVWIRQGNTSYTISLSREAIDRARAARAQP